MPCIKYLVTYLNTPPTIIFVQETKFTATKFTKHIQDLFPHYKLFFNNTHNVTQPTHQRMTYKAHQGAILTLIHNKYAYLDNPSKTFSHAIIFAFLQLIHIANQPLQSWLLITYIFPHTKKTYYWSLPSNKPSPTK